MEEEIEKKENHGNTSLPYGIAKSKGLDTTGKTPKQVWDMLSKYGITAKEEYNKLSTSKLKKEATEEKVEQEPKVEIKSAKTNKTTKEIPPENQSLLPYGWENRQRFEPTNKQIETAINYFRHFGSSNYNYYDKDKLTKDDKIFLNGLAGRLMTDFSGGLRGNLWVGRDKTYKDQLGYLYAIDKMLGTNNLEQFYKKYKNII